MLLVNHMIAKMQVTKALSSFMSRNDSRKATTLPSLMSIDTFVVEV